MGTCVSSVRSSTVNWSPSSSAGAFQNAKLVPDVTTASLDLEKTFAHPWMAFPCRPSVSTFERSEIIREPTWRATQLENKWRRRSSCTKVIAGCPTRRNDCVTELVTTTPLLCRLIIIELNWIIEKLHYVEYRSLEYNTTAVYIVYSIYNSMTGLVGVGSLHSVFLYIHVVSQPQVSSRHIKMTCYTILFLWHTPTVVDDACVLFPKTEFAICQKVHSFATFRYINPYWRNGLVCATKLSVTFCI